MGPLVIACAVMIDELRRLLPAGVPTRVLEMSLHTHPDRLHAALRTEIDQADGRHDPIILGYGLCGMAAVGLVARHSRLVLPKCDDCIGIFLGSQRRRRDGLDSDPGTFFLTRGWIGSDSGGPFADYDRLVERYGRARADRAIGLMVRHYRRLVHIAMPGEPGLEADRAYARTMADRFGLAYDDVDGSTALLEGLLAWDGTDWGDDVVVAEPGRPLTYEQFR